MELQPLLEHFKDVKGELGTTSIHKTKMHVIPQFFKPRSVPFSTEDVIGAEGLGVDRLEAEGILEKVPQRVGSTHCSSAQKRQYLSHLQCL